MARRYFDIVITGVIAVLGCAAVVTQLPVPLTILLGISLFVALGYLWSEVLLSSSVTGLERVFVGTAIALMVPVLGGLALSGAGIPLHRTSWVSLLSVVTLIGGLVLTVKRGKTAASAPRGKGTRKLMSGWHVAAFGTAVLIAIGAIALAVIGADIQKYPGYTQLWLSPLEHKSSSASLGVANQEGSTVHYRLVLLRRGLVSITWNIALANGQTWRRTVPFSSRYPITADLYRLPDLSHPYRDVANGEK